MNGPRNVVVTSREVTVRFTDAPDTEGLSSGLRRRMVRPVTAIFQSGTGDKVIAVLRGPAVRASGEVGAAHFEVKVQINDPGGLYLDAPQWVVDLAREAGVL